MDKSIDINTTYPQSYPSTYPHLIRRARPRLRVDVGGVTVGGLFRTRHYPWPLVEDVRVLQVRRLGRRTSLLELDTVTASGDERLLVFGRLDLAADPEDVAPQVLALRPTTRPR